MTRPRIYKDNAAKQDAYRKRKAEKEGKKPKPVKDQKEKEGGRLGDLRNKKPNETWEQYHNYISYQISKAKTVKTKAKKGIDSSDGAKRHEGAYYEPEEEEEYYERQREHEQQLKQAGAPTDVEQKQKQTKIKEEKKAALRVKINQKNVQLARYKSENRKKIVRQEIRTLQKEMMKL